METKEGVDEKLPIGILSLQNYTQKMMEDSSEIRAFIMNDMFDKTIEEYFVKNDIKIKAWIKDFKMLTAFKNSSLYFLDRDSSVRTIESSPVYRLSLRQVSPIE